MNRPVHPSRRTCLRHTIALSALVGLEVGPWRSISHLASAAEEFIKGPPVKDYPLKQLSPKVWMIWTPDGFPTPENQGMMANITFAISRDGVIVIDSGASLQIGEMAIRRLKTLTDKPVIAVINSHYHGDHWLGNHAFVNAYGKELPIYAHPECIQQIAGVEGSSWRSLMERWTNQASAGTQVVVPTHALTHGAELRFGDLTLRIHHYGRAHTSCDLSVEVVEDRVCYVGDVAMDRRIANMDDGSYPGTFKYYDGLEKISPTPLWVPGHGQPGPDVLRNNRELFEGIYSQCEKAVKEAVPLETAKRYVLRDPRVTKYASITAGWESNIGKYISLAYLEAEREAF